MGNMVKPSINYREPQKTAYNLLSIYKFNKVSYIFIFKSERYGISVDAYPER